MVEIVALRQFRPRSAGGASEVSLRRWMRRHSSQRDEFYHISPSAPHGLDLKPFPHTLVSMSKSSGKKPSGKGRRKALLVGVGLDTDGHKRLTTGPNFALVGGTQETHEKMTEQAIKINEKLSAKGKSLEQVSREEFDDIAASVGLQRHEPRRN